MPFYTHATLGLCCVSDLTLARGLGLGSGGAYGRSCQCTFYTYAPLGLCCVSDLTLARGLGLGSGGAYNVLVNALSTLMLRLVSAVSLI